MTVVPQDHVLVTGIFRKRFWLVRADSVREIPAFKATKAE